MNTEPDFLRYQPGLPETEYPTVVYFRPVSYRAREFFQQKAHVVDALKTPIYPGWYCFGWTGHADRIASTMSPPFTDQDVGDVCGERPVRAMWPVSSTGVYHAMSLIWKPEEE